MNDGKTANVAPETPADDKNKTVAPGTTPPTQPAKAPETDPVKKN